MTDGETWVEFDAPLELLPWGRNVYTVIVVPATLSDAATRAGTRRVEGRIEGEPVNVGLNHADVLEPAFLYAGKALQRRLGAGPGDVVACRLRPADPDDVPLPDDLADALDERGRRAGFERLPPSRRRQLLQPVEAASTPATRARRIRALVDAIPPGSAAG